MGMHLKSSGSFKNLEKFLHRSPQSYFSELHDYGRQGVALLARATPSDTGKTASSWSYRLINARGRYGIEWYNSNVNDGEVIAILNPVSDTEQVPEATCKGSITSIQRHNHLFNKMAEEIWRKVTNA
jgi:hypothetical protein